MVEDDWVIYGLKCSHSDQFRYIGMTKSTASFRLKTHLARARNGHGSSKYDWIRSHDVDQITVVVLESCHPKTRETLAFREKFWISEYLTQGHPLLNHTVGGDGGDTFTGRTHTEEAKQKVRDAKLGIPRPESVITKMRESQQKYTFGETSCVKCRRAFNSPKGCANHIAAVHNGGNLKRSQSMKKNWESGTYDEAHRTKKDQ